MVVGKCAIGEQDHGVMGRYEGLAEDQLKGRRE